MSPNLVALLYLVSGVLFILALRGLSSPDERGAAMSDRHGRHADRDRWNAARIPRRAATRWVAGW